MVELGQNSDKRRRTRRLLEGGAYSDLGVNGVPLFDGWRLLEEMRYFKNLFRKIDEKKNGYFLIRNSDENNLIYLLLTRGRKSKWILVGIVYWASSSRLSSFVHHVVRDVKLDVQEILFLLTTFSRFIGLCRVSVM